MTEFDLATEFVAWFTETAARAADTGRRPSDVPAFQSFCRALGVRPTPERLSLTRDLGTVLAEELRRMDDAELEAVEAAGTCTLTASIVLDGLERHGWRLEFLARDAAAGDRDG